MDIEEMIKKHLKLESSKATFFLFLEHITLINGNDLIKKNMLKGRKHLRKVLGYEYIYNRKKWN